MATHVHIGAMTMHCQYGALDAMARVRTSLPTSTTATSMLTRCVSVGHANPLATRDAGRLSAGV